MLGLVSGFSRRKSRMSFWGRVGTFLFLSSGSLSWAPGVRESGPCRLLCEPDLPESGLEPASLLPSSFLPLLLDEPDLLESDFDFEWGLYFLEPDLFP